MSPWAFAYGLTISSVTFYLAGLTCISYGQAMIRIVYGLSKEVLDFASYPISFRQWDNPSEIENKDFRHSIKSIDFR